MCQFSGIDCAIILSGFWSKSWSVEELVGYRVGWLKSWLVEELFGRSKGWMKMKKKRSKNGQRRNK